MRGFIPRQGDTSLSLLDLGARKLTRMPNVLQSEVLRLIEDPSTQLVKFPGKKVTRQSWSVAAGLGKTYVKDLLRKDEMKASADALRKLAEAVGLHPTHFMTLDDPPPRDETGNNSQRRDYSNEGSKLDPETTRIQSVIIFGDLEYVQSNPDPEWGDHIVGGEPAKPKARRLLRVETDRMSPRYSIGETVAIERVAPKDGDHVWIEMKPTMGGKKPAMLRLLREQDATTLTIIQYYPKRAQSTVLRKNVAAIYRVLSWDDLLTLLGAHLRPS